MKKPLNPNRQSACSSLRSGFPEQRNWQVVESRLHSRSSCGEFGTLRQPPGGRTNNKVLSPFLRPRLRLIPPPLPPRFLSLVRGAKIISSRPKKPSLSHSRYSPRSLSCSSPFSSLSIPQQLWLSFSYISSPLRASLCTVLCTVYVSYRGCGATRIAPLRK